MIDLASLPPMEVAARADKLRAVLVDGASCDALLVSKLVNIRYLTGFTGSAGLLLVLPDELLLVTDGRYRDQAEDQVIEAGVDATVRIGLTMAAQYEIIGTAATSLRLGLEAHAISWATARAMESTHLPFVKELVPTEGLVEGLRVVKDDGEVARIEAAASVATDALCQVGGLMLERVTEADLGLEIDTAIRRLGADGTSFDTIVGSGPNGAKPHHRAAGSARRIEEGDLVVIDYGALVDGYCSDMTRTFCIGRPDATQRRMLDVVAVSQQAGVDAVRAGVKGAAVDDACRTVIRDAGWADAFSHGTGHGVGLEIHEDPRVSWAADGTLAAGHVVTVEPGVYLPEHGGVRIEDTVLVLDDGCRPLTHAPKDIDFTTWPSVPMT